MRDAEACVRVSVSTRCSRCASPPSSRSPRSVVKRILGTGRSSAASSALRLVRDMCPSSRDITVPHQAGSGRLKGSSRLMLSVGCVPGLGL